MKTAIPSITFMLIWNLEYSLIAEITSQNSTENNSHLISLSYKGRDGRIFSIVYQSRGQRLNRNRWKLILTQSWDVLTIKNLKEFRKVHYGRRNWLKLDTVSLFKAIHTLKSTALHSSWIVFNSSYFKSFNLIVPSR